MAPADRSIAAMIPRITAALAISSTPFAITFVVVAYIACQFLFPRLSGKQPKHDVLHPLARAASFKAAPGLSPQAWLRFILDRAAAITFSITVALSVVLAELIFLEIANVLDPAARKLALEATITTLLISLVVVTPALEIHSLTSALGLMGSGKKSFCLGILLDVFGLTAWFAAFWWLGASVLHEARENLLLKGNLSSTNFTKGSLERIGIIGVSLMAALSGFAAVSSIWQTFGAKARKVTDVDITRKQHGLNATLELLQSKQSRLRSLEKKTGEVEPESFFNRMVGTFRGGTSSSLELQALQLECTGLETMSDSLSNELSLLRTRQDQQKASGTLWGRLSLSFSYVFCVYCFYRIGATSTTIIRRFVSPSTLTFASSDPINNFLALVAKHWDPTIDKLGWQRQIGFLLSGVMLLASFNAVWQTVLLFSKFTPSKLQQSLSQNTALLVSQISAVYVVSSALLLRSNLPREMGKGIEGALGDPLDTAFVERWFEGWFLGTVAVTLIGILIGRKLGGGGDWEDDFDDEGDVEAGHKMRMA